MAERTSVLLAGDNAILLDALTEVLVHEGFHVVAVATTRSALLDATQRYQPDLCLTGLTFPDGGVLEVLKPLLHLSPRTRVVVVTHGGNQETMRAALDAGASGFVHTSRKMRVLLEVLRRVSAGEVVVESSFARRPGRDSDSVPERLAAYLTAREAECLAMLAEGLDTLAMSRQLGVEPTTVRSHVQAVLRKLGVHTRLEAASLAMRSGLLGEQHRGAGG